MSFMKKRKFAKVAKIFDRVKDKAGLLDFEIAEESSFWPLFEIYRKYQEKKKKDHSKDLLSALRKLLKESLASDEETLFMGLLNIAREDNNHLFIFQLTLMTNDIIGEGKFEFKVPDNVYQIEFLSHSNLVIPDYVIDAVSDRQWKALTDSIVKLAGLDHLRDEYLPFLAVVLRLAWKNIPGESKLVTTTFSQLPLSYKLQFTDEIRKADSSELLDAIVKTISLDTLMDMEEDARMNTFQRVLDLGYRERKLPFSLEKPENYPIKDRFEIAAKILEEKKKVTDQDLLNSLLSIGSESADIIFELPISQDIVDYSQTLVGKDVDKLPGFMLANKRAILDVIQLHQREKITNEFFVLYIDKLSDDVRKKISSKPNTKAIIQYAIGSAMNQVLEESNFDRAMKMVDMHGKPYGQFVKMINDKMNERVISAARDQNLHDFILNLQSKLLDIKGESTSVKIVTEWIKMMGVVNNATEGAQNDHEFAVKLLDAIEITNGELHPITIAEQCLNLIEKDLTQGIPIRNIAQPSGGDTLAQLTAFVMRHMESQDSREAGSWLDAIKRAYFKLRYYTKEQTINLTDEQRIRIDEISNELLSFLIMSRREDLKKRLDSFPIEFVDIVDLGSLIRKSVNNALSVFVPDAFLSFSIPAFRVLNEYLQRPELLPIVGNRNEGVIIHQNFWVFAAAVSLPNLVNHLFRDAQYIDYVIPEYMMTMALALKRAEPILTPILNAPMTVENLMIEAFKGLSDHSAIQLTRDHVLEALEFSGWDTDIADKIIKEEHYCLFCSFALPEGATACPNCERAVEKVDLSEISFDDIKIDMDKIDLE